MKLHSQLDSERFGIPIGRAWNVTAAQVDSILECAAAERLVGLFARCATDDWTTVHALESRGFLLMDTLVYFRATLARDVAARPGASPVRAAGSEDEAAVADLAREAFADYGGHYNVDPRLDAASVREIYPSWAARAVTDRNVADVVLLAELEGRVAGFGALKSIGDGAVDALLYAVSPVFRRRGVFEDLLCASLQWGRAHGFVAMEYSTQLSNVIAQRAVCRLGFLPERSCYTFHLWRDRA